MSYSHGLFSPVVVPLGAVHDTQGCQELMLFQYIIKDTIFKMSSNLNANCYGLSTWCHKSYFSSVGCRKQWRF